MLIRHLKRNSRTTICSAGKYEDKVQSGLALTPAQMYDLAQQGKPIAANILPDDMFDDGDSYATYDVALENKRGIDVVELWEAEKDIKNKFNSFSSKKINTKGAPDVNG